MRFSIVVAAHNESGSLLQTVGSSIQSVGTAVSDFEVIVADDASWDGSIEETVARFPQVRVVRHNKRRGTSPTKHLGAQNAQGDVLLFLDGHCRPHDGALVRLVEDVEMLDGEAVVTPAVPSLDAQRWENSVWQIGHGYRLTLETFDCGWLPLDELKPLRGRRKLYESPALNGCAVAISRDLYNKLHGFDADMLVWGVEDLDFGLRSWMLGHSILHDPEAVVGHRFRSTFDNYEVPYERLLVNQLRMARKSFTASVWGEWVERCQRRNAGRRSEHPEGLWARAWHLFHESLASADAARAHIQGGRVRDEFSYAERFGLSWPKIRSMQLSPARVRLEAEPVDQGAKPSPSPFPPACPAWPSLDAWCGLKTEQWACMLVDESECPEATDNTVIDVYFVKYTEHNKDKPILKVSIKLDPITNKLTATVVEGEGFKPYEDRYPFYEVMDGSNMEFKDTDSTQFAIQWTRGGTEVEHFCNAGWLNANYQGMRGRAAKWTRGMTGADKSVSQVVAVPANADRFKLVMIYTDNFTNTPDYYKPEKPDGKHGNGEGDMPVIIGYWTGCRHGTEWHLRKDPARVLCPDHGHQKEFYPNAEEMASIVDVTTDALDDIGYTLARRPTLPAFKDAVDALTKAYETNPHGDMKTLKNKIRKAIDDAANAGQINPSPPAKGPRSHDTGFDIKPKWDSTGHDPGHPAHPGG